MQPADVARWREEFPTLSSSTHLISHSLGAAPRRARRYANEYLDIWERDSIAAWDTWLRGVGALADTVASVVGAPSGTVTLGTNVSELMARVASCFDFDGERRRVVYTDQNFPSVHYLWSAQERRGAEVVVVASDGTQAPTERLLEAIDERTLVVPVSHVLFRSGAVQDLAAIVERAHGVGALVVADCYQSAATVPLRLLSSGVDMACGGSVKWACGGPGTGWLYLKPELADRLEPASTGWFAHAEPFAFDMGPMRYAGGAARFQGGTPNVPSWATARAGWEIVAEVGVAAIREHSLSLTGLARQLAEERGFEVRTPREDDRRGGTLCFDFEGSQGVVEHLLDRRFFCDWRPGCGIRIGPHFYNDEDDVRSFMAEVDRLRR